LHKEKRNVERIIPDQPMKGKLNLYVKKLCLEVRSVWNVSPFGIGLQVDSNIDKGARILLEFQHETTELHVHGSVIWSAAFEDELEGGTPAQSYRMGIRLLPENMEINSQFFRSITDQ